MSNSMRALVGLVLLAVVAGCAQREETVIVDPVTTEPADTGKYK